MSPIHAAGIMRKVIETIAVMMRKMKKAAKVEESAVPIENAVNSPAEMMDI